MKASSNQTAQSQRARVVSRFSRTSVVCLLYLFCTSIFSLAAEETRPLRILRIAAPLDPMSLDSVMITSSLDFTFFPLLNQALLDVRGTNLTPRAAEKWHASPDWRRFTFHLREGVRFSDGRPVRAADYVHAIERTADPNTGSVGAFHFRGVVGYEDYLKARSAETKEKPNDRHGAGRWIEPVHLAGLRALDDRTLEIELAQSNLLFP